MAYAEVSELGRILQIPAPSAAQTEALQRVLDAAALQIDKFLGRAAAPTDPEELALLESVNLDWASDFWKQEQSPYGIVLLGGESPPGYPGRSLWNRHTRALLPLKESWGVG